LLLCVTWIAHAADRFSASLSSSLVDPSHFSIYCYGADLARLDSGGTEVDHRGTIDSYTAFFRDVCNRPCTNRRGVPPPEDNSISEVVLIRRSREWLRARNELMEAEAEERLALLREAGRRESAAGGGGKGRAAWRDRMGELRKRAAGWGVATEYAERAGGELGASRDSSAHWRGVAAQCRARLEQLSDVDGDANVTGLLVTFNSTDAVRKVCCCCCHCCYCC
jgi:hypothetical protein